MASLLTIPLTGLAANDPVPGTYVQIDFAQGPPSGPTTTYGALILANKITASGAATPDTVVYGPYPNSPLPCMIESDVITLFGQGSEGHRMWRRFVKKNPATPVFMIAVTESGGAAATLVVTFTVTATANGSVRFYMGDEFVDTPITSGDTVTTVATNVAASINTQGNWPVTANNASGVLTVTAKQKGPRGNWLRGSAVIQGSGVGTTSSLTAQTFFTGGTTADSNATALTTILSQRYYYLVSAAEDSTQLSALSTQVNAQALPTSGIRQTIIAASIDTAANAQTIAIALNQARAELPWCQNADRPPSEIAADMAALYSLGELPDGLGAPSRHNFDGLGTGATALDGLWDFPAPRSGTSPTRNVIKGALNNGVTPIATNAFGQTYLVMRATTRSLTSAISDYRIRDPHKVRILDFYGDALQAKMSLQFGGKDIIDNPVVGQVFPENNLVWPNMALAAINGLTQQWFEDGQFQNAGQGQAMQSNTVVIREASPQTRLSARVPAQPIDVLHQIAIDIQQVA